MATPDELLKSIGCLTQMFPKYVSQTISQLTDQFVSTVKSFTNPLASFGDLGLQQLVQQVKDQSAGGIMGDVAMVAGIVDQLSGIEVSSLMPGTIGNSTGDRIQDVLNLGSSVAGQALLTMALVPETPFAVAQRLCESILSLAADKSATLDCLGKHIRQLNNAMAVAIAMRATAVPALSADLDSAYVALQTADTEFRASRRLTNGVVAFDVNAFDRGRAALETAVGVLMPIKPGGHQSVLSAEMILSSGGALPTEYLTQANARLALSVVSQLVYVVQQEAQAIQAQTTALKFYLLQLTQIVTNYRSSPTANGVVALRLQTVASLIARLDQLVLSVQAARAVNSTHASASQLVAWSVAIQSILVTASQVRAEQLVEGAIDAGVEAALQGAYAALIAALNAINSTHVVAGVEDVTDLVANCLGIATQAQLMLARIGSFESVEDADLRTFQVLVARTAQGMTNRIGESQATAVLLEAALTPYVALQILARPSIDSLVDAMQHLGLDRARDLLSTGQFAELLGTSVDNLSYLGSAITCLTDTMAGIDDSGLRRQVSAVRDELIGQKTNQLLAAADNSDFGGLRRVLGIKNDIAALQQSASMIASIAQYLEGLALDLGLSLASIDPLDHSEFLGSADYLAVNAGGRLGSAVVDVSRPSAGVPVC